LVAASRLRCASVFDHIARRALAAKGGWKMSKKMLTLALACLVALAQTGVCAASQATKGDAADTTIEQVRAGLGNGARVTVKMKDGTRHRGSVSQRRETEFVLRDPKTGAATTIAYGDVASVEISRGHPAVKHALIDAGIVAGALCLSVLLAITVGRD
jgi:hypothetical protein